MLNDPIMEEIRRVKEEHAARYNYDIRAMARALMEEQKREGRKIVSPPLPARRSVKQCT